MNQDTLLTLRSATCSPEGVPYGLLPVTNRYCTDGETPSLTNVACWTWVTWPIPFIQEVSVSVRWPRPWPSS